MNDATLRTISVRAPMIRAMLATGFGCIGRNWPPPGNVNATTLVGQLGPVGLHVSKQGTAAEQRTMNELVQAYRLDKPEMFPTPRGHVVGRGEVLEIFDLRCFRGSPGDLVKQVERALMRRGAQVVSDRELVGWLRLGREPFRATCWLWLIGNLKACKPAPWRGVMSQFPVPLSVFSGR